MIQYKKTKSNGILYQYNSNVDASMYLTLTRPWPPTDASNLRFL